MLYPMFIYGHTYIPINFMYIHVQCMCSTVCLTCPSTKPSLRKRMTENIDRIHGIVTPNTIVNFFCLAVWIEDRLYIVESYI